MFILKYGFQTESRQVIFGNIETEFFTTREKAEKRILTIAKNWYREHQLDLPYEIDPVKMFQSVTTLSANLICLEYDYDMPSFLFEIKEINIKNTSDETPEENIINDFTEKLINDYADILHGERGISIRDAKACAKHYVDEINSTETYYCKYCNTKMKWDEHNDKNGEIWGCEKCDKTFCTKCFTDKHGQNNYMNMMLSKPMDGQWF